MTKQIFKAVIPQEIMYTLLEQISIKKETYYIVDFIAYKKMKFHNLHIPFLHAVVDYYHQSKRFYVEREFTYNSFTNIVRQICRINNIVFTSDIKYNGSKYHIDYFVYTPHDEGPQDEGPQDEGPQDEGEIHIIPDKEEIQNIYDNSAENVLMENSVYL